MVGWRQGLKGQCFETEPINTTARTRHSKAEHKWEENDHSIRVQKILKHSPFTDCRIISIGSVTWFPKASNFDTGSPSSNTCDTLSALTQICKVAPCKRRTSWKISSAMATVLKSHMSTTSSVIFSFPLANSLPSWTTATHLRWGSILQKLCQLKSYWNTLYEQKKCCKGLKRHWKTQMVRIEQ